MSFIVLMRIINWLNLELIRWGRLVFVLLYVLVNVLDEGEDAAHHGIVDFALLVDSRLPCAVVTHRCIFN